MASSLPQKKPQNRQRSLVLLALLCVVSGVYLGLRPWLRHLTEETKRTELRTQVRMEEENRLRSRQAELQALEARVAQTPADAQAQMALAQQYADLGRMPEALQRADIAVKLLDHSVESMLVLADIQKRSRQYDRAIHTYKAILARNPGEGRATVSLCAIYSTLAWTQDALALLEPAVQASPNTLPLRVPLAMAYVQQNDFAAAEKQLLFVRAHAPDDASLWSPLVEVYLKSNQYRKAIETARDAIRLQPASPALPLELGRAYMALNDLENARAAFETTLSLDPQNIPARYQLALYYQKTNQAARAIQELETVRQHAPNYEQTNKILGQLYLQNGRAEVGRRLLAEDQQNAERIQKLARFSLRVSSHPNQPEAHLQMAQAYLDAHDYPHARVELDRTLELAAGNRTAQRLLASLPAADTTGQ